MISPDEEPEFLKEKEFYTPREVAQQWEWFNETELPPDIWETINRLEGRNPDE